MGYMCLCQEQEHERLIGLHEPVSGTGTGRVYWVLPEPVSDIIPLVGHRSLGPV